MPRGVSVPRGLSAPQALNAPHLNVPHLNVPPDLKVPPILKVPAALNAPLSLDPVPRFGDRRRSRIGLLGGSFNPAHQGHRHVAEMARRRLRLDQVWLLVSPGNPLKPEHGMAPLSERLASARGVADGRRVVASPIEARLGTRFTIDTLCLLLRRFPRVDFVWIAGADIFEQLPQWRHWQKIARLVPFAVLPRPGYNHRALAGRAAHVLRRARRLARTGAVLARCAPPAWVFLTAPQDAASASAIRAALPDAMRATYPSALCASHPSAIRATQPSAVRATHPSAVRATHPSAIRATHASAIRATSSGAVRATHPDAVREVHPVTVSATHSGEVLALPAAAICATTEGAEP